MGLGSEDKRRVGATAAETIDEMDAQGELDMGPDSTLRAVAVIVAVDHGNQTTVNYRFKDALGNPLDSPTGREMLQRVQQAID